MMLKENLKARWYSKGLNSRSTAVSETPIINSSSSRRFYNANSYNERGNPRRALNDTLRNRGRRFEELQSQDFVTPQDKIQKRKE
jgi:hypothetical protein